MQQTVISFLEFQFLNWDSMPPNNAEAEHVPANNLSQNEIPELSSHFHSLRTNVLIFQICWLYFVKLSSIKKNSGGGHRYTSSFLQIPKA